MDWNRDEDIDSGRWGGEGGYCNCGVGGVSILIIGDDGSSFFTLHTPFGLCSWFLQTRPDFPSNAFLNNSLFNHTTLSKSFSLRFITLCSANLLFASLWFKMSWWSKSCRSNSDVSCWTKWTYELSSNVLGSAKKYCCESMSPWLNWGPAALRAFFFCERVFMEGAEWIMWTIIDIARYKARGRQTISIDCTNFVLLTVELQGHCCIADFSMLSQ